MSNEPSPLPPVPPGKPFNFGQPQQFGQSPQQPGHYPSQQPHHFPPPRRGLGAGKILLIVLAVLIVLGVGAGVMLGPKIKEAAAKLAKKPVVGPKPVMLTAEQEKDLTKFMMKVEQMANDQDKALLRQFDTDKLFTRVFVGENLTDKQLQEYLGGATEGFNRSGGGEILGQFFDFQWKFLKLTKRDQFASGLFRLSSQEGVMFLEIMANPEGKFFKIIDIYDWGFGLCASDKARLVAGGRFDQAAEERIRMVNAAHDFLQAGKFAEAKAQLAKWPRELRESKGGFMMEANILSAMNMEEGGMDAYVAHLKKFPQLFKGDKIEGQGLLLSAVYLTEGDVPKGIAALEEANSYIGGDGDAYLNMLIAGLHLSVDDAAAAEAPLAKAKRSEPELDGLVDIELKFHCAKKEYDKVLETLREKFGDSDGKSGLGREFFKDPSNEGVYDGFLKSPEFAEWEKEINEN